MANEDTYIFREKIRHPSNKDEWIITRDYGPLSTISNTKKDSQTITATNFTLSGQSYNFTESVDSNSNIIWTHNNFTIDKENIVWPEQTDTNGIRDIVVPSGTSTNIIVSDITDTVTFSGSYAENLATVTIVDTASPSWENTFITKSINTDNLSIVDYVKTNDILIIPNVETNGNFTVDMYQINEKQETLSNVTASYTFNYNIDNINNLDDIGVRNRTILNVLSPNDEGINAIKFTDILNKFSTISKFDFTVDEDDNTVATLSSMSLNNENLPISGDNISNYYFYGNGILLKRFNYTSTLENNDFNYEWFLVRDKDNSKYILKFKINNEGSYIIDKLIRVVVRRMQSNNEYILQLNPQKIIEDYSQIRDSELIIGWNDDLFKDNETYLRYNLFDCYAATDINFALLSGSENIINNNTKQENKIKEYYPAVGFSGTPSSAVSFNTVTPITLNIYTDIADTPLNTIDMTVSDSTTYIGYLADGNSGSITINTSNIVINNGVNTLQKWLDSILEFNNLVSYKDINLHFFWNEKTGNITHTGTISNVYSLTSLNSSSNQIISQISKYTYKNWWNNMQIFSGNNNNLNKFYINYFGNTLNIGFPINAEMKTYTATQNKNKVWILNKDANILIVNNNYYIVSDLLKTEKEFLNLVQNLYTTININISTNQTITYNLYAYNNGIRYYDGEGKLLNLGDKYTPVYIENGEFKPCADIRDIFVHISNSPTYGELWIDPDGN